ncbi:MAG: hypothetical protein OHK0040_03360 [bacterium]
MGLWLEKFKKLNNPSVILGFFVLTAFILRLLPWNSIIIDWGKTVIFIQPDAYYQMRRSMIWATNFPNLVTMDYYMAYPFGAECPWPPLYNFTIAVLTLIFSGGKPNAQVLQLITALLPPIIAALCIIPVYKIVKVAWRNERIAIFASFFAIIMPGMLGYSTIGSGDHHVAETFLFLWFFYYGLKLIQAILDGRKYVNEILKTGFMISLGILIWQGQVVFFTVWAVYLFLVVLLNYKDSDFTKKISSSFMFAAFIGSAVAAFVRFIIPRSTEQTLFDFGFFSYFQPLYVSFIFFAVFIFQIFFRKVKENRTNLIKSGIVLLIVVVILLAIAPLRKGIIDGIKFLLKSDPWHSSINEFQTTFSFKMMMNNYNTKQGLMDIVYFLSFLFPLCFGFMYLYRVFKWKENKLYFLFYQMKGIRNISNGDFKAKRYQKPDEIIKIERESRIRILFYGVSGVMIGLLAFYQKRWGNAFSPILAMGIALFANAAYLKIKAGHGILREFMQWRREKKKIKAGLLSRFIIYWERSPFVLSLLCVLFVMVPYFYIAEGMLNTQGYPIQSDLYNSLVWIKNYTPKTSHLWKPDKKPEYAILAPWDHGHYIQYISERPTIVNNFGHQLRGDGFKVSNYVWSCETEEELVDIVERYNVRFLFLNDPINYISKKSAAYLKPGFLDKYIIFQDGHFGEKIPAATELFFSLPLPRIWVFDGSSTSYGPAIKHFRLVFESQNASFLQYFEDIELKFYKMYEYVKGAKIVGKASPRSIVFFTAHFVTNFDREFDWNAAAIADENGNFKGTLPYATADDNIFVKPLSPYIVYADGKVLELVVSNEDVINGKTINIDLTKGKKAPKAFEENVKGILKNIAGQVKSTTFINIHKKPNGENK